MGAVVLTLLILYLHFLGCTATLPILRPVIPKGNTPSIPNIPVKKQVSSIVISRQNVQTNTLLERGTIAGIQNLVYTRMSYNVLLSVGNIPFEIALDTGSSDFWVVSDLCQTKQCKDVPRFPLNKYNSPSFLSVNNNQTGFNVTFADGTSASGFVARETVRISNVQSVGQAFGLVTSLNLTLGQSTSGVLGLGFSRLSRIAAITPSAPPFLSALAELGDLAYPIFGLNLKRNASGTLSMGAIDASVVSNVSRISWYQVVPFSPLPGENVTSPSLYLHWALPLNNLTVNGTSIILHPTYPSITGTSPLALLDVGTNGIYGPYKDVAAIFSAMGTVRQVAEGNWAVACDVRSVMIFTFGGANFTLQPSDYLIGPTDGDPNLCLSWPAALPPSSDGLDWHLGTPFLGAVYSIYSYGIAGHEPPLIGLYPLSDNGSLTDTPALLSSAFSSLSATIPTTAPAILLPTPSYTTPVYLFNTSATPLPTAGQIIPTQSDLGASSYSALFGEGTILKNATALPEMTSPAALVTLIITDASGIRTTTSTASSIPTELLGKPWGSTSGSRGLRWDQYLWLLTWLTLSTVGWTWTLC